MALQVKIAEERDIVILAFEGRIDTLSIDDLNLGFDEVKRRGKKKVILMFRDLESINSRGITELLSFLKWAQEEKKEVKIVEIHPNLAEVFEPLGLESYARIHDSLSDARKAFRQGNEEEEEMQEEQEMVVDEDFRRGGRSEGSKMPLILIAGGVFVLLILVIAYMTRESSSDVQGLQKRVGLLEQKLAQLEGQTKEVIGVSGKIDGLKKDFIERSQQVEKEVAKLKQEMESVSGKAALPALSPAKPVQKAGKYHTVAKGETLFGISKKYGITLEELRRLNNLKANQSVGVGQKLIVGSP